MAQSFKETAHLKTDLQEYSKNFDAIKWNNPVTPDSSEEKCVDKHTLPPEEVAEEVAEEWRDVIGYEGAYQVSSNGKIKRLKRTVEIYGMMHSSKFTHKERVIKGKISRNGYHAVSLSINKKVKHFNVHRIVAIAFIEPVNGKPFVNHKNGIKTDNRIENLEWVSASENSQHSFDILGKERLKGSRHPATHLNESIVIEIREAETKGITSKDLSEKHGVSPACIRDIWAKRRWRHI